MKHHLTWLILFIFIAACNLSEKNAGESDTPYLVILSMDGFRWDYPEKANTPNLDYIEKIGVRAEASIPCFPTKTFPNHYSIATGLYPDHHGIILNSFYAPDLDKNYAIGNNVAVTDPDFYFGEPIWATAEKQGVRSASYFWVGSEAPHDNIYPSYYHAYDGKVPFEDRINGVINWLKLPEENRPHLIMWYLQEPDSKGHDYGPESPEMVSTIEYLDSLIGVFDKKIRKLPIADKINIIITSDHGMSAISKEKAVYLYEIINKDWSAQIDGGNPAYTIEAKDDYYDTLYNTLLANEHITVWKKSEVPERLHFGTSDRVKDFVVVADSAWSLWESDKKYNYTGGAHGYDNINKDMHAIFYAYGPVFKKGYKQAAFHNVDIYPLICEILELKPQDVDGNLETIQSILEKKE